MMEIKEAFGRVRGLPWSTNNKTGSEYGIIESYLFKNDHVKVRCRLKHLLGMSLSMELEIHSKDTTIERSYKDTIPDTIIQQLETILGVKKV